MCSVFLYRTLVGVGRALVVRTQTLVWTKRLNSLLDAADFRGFDFIAERRGIAQVRFDFVARKLAPPGRTIPSSSRNLAPLAFRDGAADIAECKAASSRTDLTSPSVEPLKDHIRAAAARHQLRSAIGKAAPGAMPASHT